MSPVLALPVCGWISRWLAHCPALILKPLFIHVCVLGKPMLFPTRLGFMEGRPNYRHFHSSLKKKYPGSVIIICKIRTIIKYIKTEMGVIPGFIFYVSRNPENVRPLVTSLTVSPLFDAQCACVCVRVCGLCEFTCLFVYCATTCSSWSHRSAN